LLIAQQFDGLALFDRVNELPPAFLDLLIQLEHPVGDLLEADRHLPAVGGVPTDAVNVHPPDQRIAHRSFVIGDRALVIADLRFEDEFLAQQLRQCALALVFDARSTAAIIFSCMAMLACSAVRVAAAKNANGVWAPRSVMGQTASLHQRLLLLLAQIVAPHN